MSQIVADKNFDTLGLGKVVVNKPSVGSYNAVLVNGNNVVKQGQYDGMRWDVKNYSNSHGVILYANNEKDKDRIIDMLNNEDSPLSMLKTVGRPVVVISQASAAIYLQTDQKVIYGSNLIYKTT